ncbi:MAG: metallophosphoesterase [Rhizomicrobium sp.]
MAQNGELVTGGITKRQALLTGFFCLMPFGSANSQSSQKLLFSIGAIADCQYADEPDAGKRMYRMAPEKLRQAIAALDKLDLAFVVHLGDFIDQDWHSYDTILPIAQASKNPLRFVLGNHDLEVADDKKLLVPAKLGMPARYYSFDRQGCVFVVLDGNDMSTYGWPEADPKTAESRKIHDERYPTAPLWDGGLGDEQMAWLDRTLADADAAQRKVMILCHFPVYPENPHDLWNAPDVIALLEKHPSVKMWLNGHNHDGNYGEKNGVHYLNLRGMLDTPETSYAVLEFFADKIVVYGTGREQDFTLPLR